MGNFSRGFKSTSRNFSHPIRVTEHIRPGNPPDGLKSLTGAVARETFGKPKSEFAEHPRKALQAMSKVRGVSG